MRIDITLSPEDTALLTAAVSVLAPTETVSFYLSRVVEKFVRGTLLVEGLRKERDEAIVRVANAFKNANNATRANVATALGIPNINIPDPPEGR